MKTFFAVALLVAPARGPVGSCLPGQIAARPSALHHAYRDDGIGEWGFAAVVEVDGHRILFDTGARPDTVLNNAKELGVDLSNITDVVLSHNHADHTGGLMTLRRAARGKESGSAFPGSRGEGHLRRAPHAVEGLSSS